MLWNWKDDSCLKSKLDKETLFFISCINICFSTLAMSAVVLTPRLQHHHHMPTRIILLKNKEARKCRQTQANKLARLPSNLIAGLPLCPPQWASKRTRSWPGLRREEAEERESKALRRRSPVQLSVWPTIPAGRPFWDFVNCQPDKKVTLLTLTVQQRREHDYSPEATPSSCFVHWRTATTPRG